MTAEMWDEYPEDPWAYVKPTISRHRVHCASHGLRVDYSAGDMTHTQAMAEIELYISAARYDLGEMAQ